MTVDFWLESLDRAHPEKWPLGPGATGVGRASQNPIRITDPSVSREHSVLRVVGGKVQIGRAHV